MRAEFPPLNAFEGASSTTCKVYKGPSLGPCLFGLNGHREDISEGELGLPVVFAFKILNTDCSPAAGITVEVWHTNCDGLYSGNTAQATYLGPNWNVGNICTTNDPMRAPRAKASTWHRGSQVTNSQGEVFFRSCFPGWYTGRTNHVHLRCSQNNTQLFFTQFAWTDELCREIHVNHPEYSGRPQDTPLSGFDPEFGGPNRGTDMIFTVKKLSDGSMLSSKIVTMG